MLPYEEQAYIELEIWKKKILKKPGFFDLASKGIQNRLNKIIPEKVHSAITVAIEKMVKAVLFGAKFITKEPREDSSLQLREAFVKERIEFYRKTASAEGAITGAGGFLLGLADYRLIEKLGETAINCYRMRKVSPLKIIDHPIMSKFRLK
jgi:hypothetical protein